ncbi:MAG: hypothetical protein QG623_263 [Patescibacteria group bacterium]|nr:hypothetical protein [Patescibacteria group bacterium]
MSARSGIPRIDGQKKRLTVVDLGFPKLDRVLGNPCEILGGAYRLGRGTVSDGLGAISSALSDAGDVVSVLADRTALKVEAASSEEPSLGMLDSGHSIAGNNL